MGKTSNSLRGKALSIMRSSIRACDPFGAIGKQVKLKGARLTIDGRAHDLDRVRRILLIGAGKASARMAQALESILEERIDSGLVITKTCHRAPLGGKIELAEGGHPLPDTGGKRATERIVKLLSGTTADDLVIFLLSGGASALLVSPVPGITLKETIKLTKELLRCGADIKEMNALRKHISQVKGGRLAEVAQPARVLSLILSDVIGDRLDSIGSGPTAPDRTTFGDCLKIVEKYRLKNRIPASIYRHLKRGAQGKIKETPKPGDPIFRRVKNVIIGSNRMALEAAKKRAEELGFNTFVFPRPVAGDTTRAAPRHGQLLKD
jgi:glycerate 2-kinase